MRRTLHVQPWEKAKTHGEGRAGGRLGRVLVAMTKLYLNTWEIPLYAQCDEENMTLHILLTLCVSFVNKHHDWTE